MLRDKLKDNTAQIAHDIRSPLFALKAVLESPGEFTEKKRKLLMNAAQRLEDIANGILLEKKYSQITNIKNLIIEILNEKKISYPFYQFNFTSCPQDVFLALNSTEMKRIISNLLQNSIEAYEGKAGEINVSLVRALGVTKITVSDNGKGIPLSLIPKIYGTSHGKKGGSGLGLSHAKNYIESIGGEIEITSILSKGTEISLVLKN